MNPFDHFVQRERHCPACLRYRDRFQAIDLRWGTRRPGSSDPQPFPRLRPNEAVPWNVESRHQAFDSV